MYSTIKDVISSGSFKLAEIQQRVKKLYIWGDLTEEQADELIKMAQEKASAAYERPEVMTILRNLDARIKVIEKKLSAQENVPSGEPREYETWVAWDGISNKYQKGVVVSHGDKLWQSVFNGQNVWEPGAVGTENMWVEYTPETEEVAEDV